MYTNLIESLESVLNVVTCHTKPWIYHPTFLNLKRRHNPNLRPELKILIPKFQFHN